MAEKQWTFEEVERLLPGKVDRTKWDSYERSDKFEERGDEFLTNYMVRTRKGSSDLDDDGVITREEIDRNRALTEQRGGLGVRYGDRPYTPGQGFSNNSTSGAGAAPSSVGATAPSWQQNWSDTSHDDLVSSISKIEDQGSDERKDWKNLAEFAYRMDTASGAGALEAEQQYEVDQMVSLLMHSYGDRLAEHLKAIDPDWYEQVKDRGDQFEPSKGAKVAGGALRALGFVGNALDQSAEPFRGGIASLINAASPRDDIPVGRLEQAKHGAQQLLKSVDVTRLLPGETSISQSLLGAGDSKLLEDGNGKVYNLDRDNDGHMSLSEALVREAPQEAGTARGTFRLLDFVGEAALDPLNLVTGGSSEGANMSFRMAREGAEAMAERGAVVNGLKVTPALAEKITQQVQRRGLSSLTKEQVEVFRTVMQEGLSNSRRSLDEAMSAVEKGGQTGLRLRNTDQTLLPTGRLGDIGRATGLLSDRKFETTSEMVDIGQEVVERTRQYDPIIEEQIFTPFKGPSQNVPTGALPDDMEGAAYLYRAIREGGEDMGVDPDKIEQLVHTLRRRGLRSISGADAEVFNNALMRGLQDTGVSLSDALYALDEAGRHGLRFGRKNRGDFPLLGEIGVQLRTADQPMPTGVAEMVYSGGRKVSDTENVFKNFGERLPGGRIIDDIGEGMDLATDGDSSVLSRRIFQGKHTIMDRTVNPIMQEQFTTMMTGFQRGLMGTVADNIPLLEKFRPRSGVRAKYGNATADQVGEALSVNREMPEVAEAQARLGLDPRNATPTGMKETLNEGVRSALRRQGAVTEDLVNEELYNLLFFPQKTDLDGAAIEGFDKLKKAVQELTTEWGLEDASQFVRNPDLDASYDDLLQEVANGIDKGSLSTPAQANRLAREALGADVDLFLEDPIVAVAHQINSMASAKLDARVVDTLGRMEGFGGAKLAASIPSDELGSLGHITALANKLGVKNLNDYTVGRLADGTYVAVERTVAEAMEDAGRMFGDASFQGKVAGITDEVNRIFAAHATVGLVNPGFHMRNAQGNIMLMALEGTTNPLWIRRASQLQRLMGEASTVMREQGSSLDDALRSVGATPDQMNLIKEAQRTGVLDRTYTQDLLRNADLDTLSSSSKSNSKFKEWWNDGSLSPGNLESGAWTYYGRNIGTAIEQNARLAVFARNMAEGAPASYAASRVKQFLFDYGDLTRFESDSVRVLSRFYTFTRKNLGAQAKAMKMDPIKWYKMEQGVDALEDAILGGAGYEDDERAMEALPPWYSAATAVMTGASPIAVFADIETPMEQGLTTMTLPLLLATEALRDDKERKLAGDPGFTQLVAQTLLDQFASPAVSAMETIMGSADQSKREAANKADNQFSTGNMSAEQLRDTMWWQLASDLMPSIDRGLRYMLAGQQVQNGAGDIEGLDDGTRRDLLVLSQLFGVKTGAVDVEESERYARSDAYYSLRGMLDDLEEIGVEVPDIEQLRKEGMAPARNRAIYHALYAGSIDDDGNVVFDNQDDKDRLLSLIPKDVRERFNLPEPVGDSTISAGGRPEDEGEAKVLRAEEMVKAMEWTMGRQLTVAERATLARMNLGVSDSDAERVGVEGERTNVFLPQDPREKKTEEEIWLDIADSVAGFGFTPEAMQQMYPALNEGERLVGMAREAGVSDQELADYLQGNEINRTAQGHLNALFTGDPDVGPFELEYSRYRSFDNEDYQKAAKKAEDTLSVLRLYLDARGYNQLTDEGERIWAKNQQMTSDEMEMLGILDLKSPGSKEDQTPDAERYRIARDKDRAVAEGMYGQ